MASALDRPCSARQIGTVHGQFRRLGLGDPGWRGCRLAIAGALTGRPGLGSIRALAGGEAGYLIRTLGLAAATAATWPSTWPGQPLEDREQVARLASTFTGRVMMTP